MNTNPIPPSAPLFRRLFAVIYDSLIVLALWLIATMLVVALRHGEPVAPETHWYQILLLCVWLTFLAGFWCFGGQTLGMRAWRLSVISTQPQTSLNLRAVMLRTFGLVISIIPLGLGFLWMLIDRERMTWYDRLSHTRVVMGSE